MTATSVITVPLLEYHKSGAGGCVKAVLRAVPVAVLRPVAGVGEAVSQALEGVNNDIMPGRKVRDMDRCSLHELLTE
jgi:autophagy-related protein 2